MISDALFNCHAVTVQSHIIIPCTYNSLVLVNLLAFGMLQLCYFISVRERERLGEYGANEHVFNDILCRKPCFQFFILLLQIFYCKGTHFF